MCSVGPEGVDSIQAKCTISYGIYPPPSTAELAMNMFPARIKGVLRMYQYISPCRVGKVVRYSTYSHTIYIHMQAQNTSSDMLTVTNSAHHYQDAGNVHS